MTAPPHGVFRAASVHKSQEAAQILGHRVGRLITPLGFLVDRLENDGFQIARDAPVQDARTHRLMVLDLVD